VTVSTPLIVGVSYRVTGREADQWFVRGTRVTFCGESTSWIDKGERQTELSFVAEGGKLTVLRRDSLSGLEAVVPAQPSAAPVALVRAWKTLFTGNPEDRSRAFGALAIHTDPLWHRELALRALADRKAGASLFERWSVANPGAAASLEPLLAEGLLSSEAPVRLLFARLHNPYFLGDLEAELASTELVTVRAALDELALFPRGMLQTQVESLARHENPSVAIKAQRLLAASPSGT
jgi:hypothetical protein